MNLEKEISVKESMMLYNGAATKDILSLREACEYMDVTRSFLHKQTHLGKITHYKPSRKLVYFKRSDLDNWLLCNCVPSCNTQMK